MESDKKQSFGEARTGIPEEEDFESLFEATQSAEAAASAHLSPGEVVRGRIVAIGKESAFVDLGGKSEGNIALAELMDDGGQLTVKAGDEIEAYVISVRHGVQLSMALAKGARDAELLQSAYESGIPVEGRVEAVNKGGVEV